MRPLAGPTLRAGAWNRTMRCYSLLVWIDHTASAAPSLARFQAPAQARFSAGQTPNSEAFVQPPPEQVEHRLAIELIEDFVEQAVEAVGRHDLLRRRGGKRAAAAWVHQFVGPRI